jgi:hypothetical protein
VAVALLPDGGAAVCDSMDPTHKPLIFPKQQWSHFVSGVKTHQFDL